jgi:hypothetical protein
MVSRPSGFRVVHPSARFISLHGVGPPLTTRQSGASRNGSSGRVCCAPRAHTARCATAAQLHVAAVAARLRPGASAPRSAKLRWSAASARGTGRAAEREIRWADANVVAPDHHNFYSVRRVFRKSRRDVLFGVGHCNANPTAARVRNGSHASVRSAELEIIFADRTVAEHRPRRHVSLRVPAPAAGRLPLLHNFHFR